MTQEEFDLITLRISERQTAEMVYATTFHDVENCGKWMDKPNMWFDGKSPNEMISAGRFDDVMSYIHRVEWGVYC